MTSAHTKTAVRQRAYEFGREYRVWGRNGSFIPDHSLVESFVQQEYDTIPEQERVGKGLLFISRAVAEGFYKVAKQEKVMVDLSQLVHLFDIGERSGNRVLTYLALNLLGEHANAAPSTHKTILGQVDRWGSSEDWEIRESSCVVVRACLKKNPAFTLNVLENWSQSADENIRRLVAESLRPMSDIRWLRDPSKNDRVLSILSTMLTDSSTYVRKSVGNNLKDLSKYMPERILDLAKEWIATYGVVVTEDLASKSKSEIGPDQYYLVWTLKHTFRWIQARHLEYHETLRSVMGENYVNYFDEKRNKLAKPK